MQNEDELIQRLEQIGFRCVAPHELSFAEQMQAFSNAKVVVGQFGAALWNLPFTPRGGAVIEIMTNNYVGNEYFYISHLMNHKYVRVMVSPTEARGSAYKGHSFNFSVPVDDVLRIVAELM
jgi:capsular polysaccharide biosynthesis protein